MGAGLPQQATLPKWPASWDNPQDVEAWGRGIQRTIAHIYFILTYALNGTTNAAVAADRPTTPAYNGALFYATDTAHLYVGAAGAWVQVI